MSNHIEPFPLDSRAVLRLIHFDVWASNFLRARLNLDQPVRVVPGTFKITNPRTGQFMKLSTNLEYEDETVEAMEELRLSDAQ